MGQDQETNMAAYAIPRDAMRGADPNDEQKTFVSVF